MIGCLMDGGGHGQPDAGFEAIGEFGPKAKAAVPVLVKLLAARSSKDIIRAVAGGVEKNRP